MPRLRRNLCRGMAAFWLLIALGSGVGFAQDSVGERLTALEKKWNPPAPSAYAFDPVGARLDALESVAHPNVVPITTDPVGARLAALEAVPAGCTVTGLDFSNACNSVYLLGFQ